MKLALKYKLFNIGKIVFFQVLWQEDKLVAKTNNIVNGNSYKEYSDCRYLSAVVSNINNNGIVLSVNRYDYSSNKSVIINVYLYNKHTINQSNKYVYEAPSEDIAKKVVNVIHPSIVSFVRNNFDTKKFKVHVKSSNDCVTREIYVKELS